MKAFSLGAILSITIGRLLCTMPEVYGILNYMTGDNLFTHQLPRAGRECIPYLLASLPQLAEVSADDVTADNWHSFLERQIAKYGEYHSIKPIPPDDHDRIDPITELEQMTGKQPIVIVV